MVPTTQGGKTLAGITAGGTSVSYSTTTFHGVTYALINSAAAGNYIANYQ